jgi:hypothetical protein
MVRSKTKKNKRKRRKKKGLLGFRLVAEKIHIKLIKTNKKV